MSIGIPPTPIDPNAQVWDNYVERGSFRASHSDEFSRIDLQILWRRLVNWQEPAAPTAKVLDRRMHVGELPLPVCISILTDEARNGTIG